MRSPVVCDSCVDKGNKKKKCRGHIRVADKC